MKIEPDDVQQFQRLWKEQFHTELNEEDAQTKANFLLNMMRVIYQPLPRPQTNSSNQLFPPDF